MKEIPAIVLNDYPGKPYATWVKEGIKTIETRGRKFSYSGDILICCGAKSSSVYAGEALCVVHLGVGREMKDEDAKAACIENAPGRIAYDLTNLRQLLMRFKFSHYAVKKNFQGIFSVSIPDFTGIIE